MESAVRFERTPFRADGFAGRGLKPLDYADMNLLAEDTGFEPIPTESGHRSEIRTHNLTTRRSKSFPISLFDESLLCYHYTNPQYKTRRIYLCPKIGIEPIIFAFEANVLTF